MTRNEKQSRRVYRGLAIRKDDFGKFEVPGLTWGDQPGEFVRTRTLREAKRLIDSYHAGDWLNR